MLVCLDLGAVTGFAYGNPADPAQPVTGFWRMPATGEDIGAYLQAARRNMEGLLRHTATGAAAGSFQLAFEQPILPRAKLDDDGKLGGLNTNIGTLRKLYGYAGLVEMMALDVGATVSEVPVPSVKLALAGHGHAKKGQMVAAYEAAGMEWPATLREAEKHNVADAYGVWLVLASKLAPERAADRTPLFSAAAG